MNEIQESLEAATEFRLSKKKFLINLIKLILKMKKIRKKAEEILLDKINVAKHQSTAQCVSDLINSLMTLSKESICTSSLVKLL